MSWEAGDPLDIKANALKGSPKHRFHSAAMECRGALGTAGFGGTHSSRRPPTPLHIRHPLTELDALPAVPYPAGSHEEGGSCPPPPLQAAQVWVYPRSGGCHFLGLPPPSCILRQCRERIPGDRNGTGSKSGLRGTWDLPPSLGGEKAGLVGELLPTQPLELGTLGGESTQGQALGLCCDLLTGSSPREQ